MALTVVIRAGGVGSRLWPISRERAPKQFHALLGEATLLKQTYLRARKVTDARHIFVTTSAELARQVRKQLPQLRADHLIVEPARRDTGPSIGLESLLLAKIDPKAIVLGMPADHVILNEKEFIRLCRVAEKTIRKHPDHLLSMGVKITYPSTGFGYIKIGRALERINGEQVYTIDSFKEKPDLKTAKKFFADWRYLWNAAYFVWSVEHIIDLYNHHAPRLMHQLAPVRAAIGSRSYNRVVKEVYPAVEKIAVDPLIIEKAAKRLVLIANIGWSDIGDWREIHKILDRKQKDERHIRFDTTNTFVHTSENKLVALLGVSDLAIIDTPDALLVTHIERTQDVKKIVEHLKERKQHKRYL